MTQGPGVQKPLPEPSTLTEPFWQGLRRREVRIQRCGECRRYVFYPRALCPYCLSETLEWVRASGKGRVYSYTIVRRAMHPAFQPAVPYVFAIIELEEGVRLPSNVINCRPEDVRVDMRVKAVYDDVTSDITLLKFEPE